MKSYLIVLISCFLVLIMNRFFLKNKYKYINIILIMLGICSNISIYMNSSQLIIEEVSYVYIPLVFFIMITIVISISNIQSFKLTFDELILLIILANTLIYWTKEQIYDVAKFLNIFIMYFSIYLISKTYKSLRYIDFDNIRNFINYIAIFNGSLSIVQYITGKKLLPGMFSQSIYYGNGSNIVKRIVGFAGTNNSGGNFSAILFSIVFFNYIKNRKKIDLIALIFTVIFSILTLTRIGYLTIFIELLVYLLFTKWNTIKYILKKVRILIISIFISLLVIISFGQQIYNILFIKRGNTSMWRDIQFNNIFEKIIPNNTFFIGIGPGQYKYYAYYNLGYKDIDIHSQYINILAEQGVFIFILFLILNIFLLLKALKCVEENIEKSFVIGLFLANFVCCNYNPNQYYLINNIFYYLLIYLIIYKNKNIQLKNCCLN